MLAIELSRNVDGEPFDEPATFVHAVKVGTWIVLSMIDVDQFMGDQFAP